MKSYFLNLIILNFLKNKTLFNKSQNYNTSFIKNDKMLNI